MSEVLRAQLMAARASAVAMVASIDAALGAFHDRPQGAPAPKTRAWCEPHGCGCARTKRIEGMGGATPYELCLDCGCRREPATAEGGD